jgi:hypothetical protein
MPGVITRTATRSGPVNQPIPASGRYFVAGQFERGPHGIVSRIRSLAELEVIHGGRVAYGAAYDDLRTFFEEGGTEAYVTRVVGAAATQGTLSLAGEDDPAVTITALGAGAWSTGVTVAVTAGTAEDTVRVVVEGPLPEDTEVYDGLATAADVVAALTRSRYVRGTDAGGGLPVVAAAAALSAGTDDRASITATVMANALDKFGREYGAGAIAIPGYPAALVGAKLRDHAKATRRLALLAAAVGASDADYRGAADALIGADGEYVGLFGPWVRIPAGGTATKLISPEGYVAAARARAHLEAGPSRAPAGELSVARFVVGVERELTRAQGDSLDEAHVSAIRTIAGTTRLYGWRSLSPDVENYALLNGRDVLNTVAVAVEERLERFVFRTIDGRGQLLASVYSELVGILEPMRAAGGLFERIVDGAQLDPGYSVDVGETVNTLAVLNANKIAAVIALRVSPVGSLIDVTIVKAGLTATV